MFGLKGARDRTADEVVDYLQDFIEGTGGAWDWDDFTSVPITDPRLESIRQRAELIELPATSEGMVELGKLLQEARAIMRVRWTV